MTPEQLKRGEEIQRAIKDMKANYPLIDFARGMEGFVVSASRVQPELFDALLKAYEKALDARVAALEAEFEAL